MDDELVYPSLDSDGEILEPRFLVYLKSDPTRKYGSNDETLPNQEPNDVIHRLLMKEKKLPLETVMEECCSLVPQVEVFDTWTNVQFQAPYLVFH